MRSVDLDTSDLSAVSTAGANANADATISAPGAGKRVVVQGISVSFGGGTPAASQEVTLEEDPAGTPVTRDAFFLPNAVMTPVVANYKQPLRFGLNKSVRLRIPALGASITGRAVIKYNITSD